MIEGEQHVGVVDAGGEKRMMQHGDAAERLFLARDLREAAGDVAALEMRNGRFFLRGVLAVLAGEKLLRFGDEGAHLLFAESAL